MMSTFIRFFDVEPSTTTTYYITTPMEIVYILLVLLESPIRSRQTWCLT